MVFHTRVFERSHASMTRVSKVGEQRVRVAPDVGIEQLLARLSHLLSQLQTLRRQGLVAESLVSDTGNPMQGARPAHQRTDRERIARLRRRADTKRVLF